MDIGKNTALAGAGLTTIGRIDMHCMLIYKERHDAAVKGDQ
jgi:hypothetical protein